MMSLPSVALISMEFTMLNDTLTGTAKLLLVYGLLFAVGIAVTT